MAALARLLQQHQGSVPGPDAWTGFLNDLVGAITADTQEVVELANAQYELKLGEAQKAIDEAENKIVKTTEELTKMKNDSEELKENLEKKKTQKVLDKYKLQPMKFESSAISKQTFKQWHIDAYVYFRNNRAHAVPT